jgi:hypothetical protein
MCLLGPAIHPSSSAACFGTPYTILVRALPFSTSEQAPEFWLSEDYICGCHQRSALTQEAYFFYRFGEPVPALTSSESYLETMQSPSLFQDLRTKKC